MKLSRILLSSYQGAYEKQFAELCLRLSAENYKIQAIIDRKFAYRSKLCASNAIQLVELGGNQWNPFARNKLKAALQNFQPELVETHGWLATQSAAHACENLRLPLAIRLYDEGGRLDWRGPSQVYSGRFPVPPPCYLACNSMQVKVLAQQEIAAERVRLVHDYYAGEAVAKMPASKVGDCFYFVAMGPWLRDKGFHVLLQAFRLLLDQQFHARLLLGGEGPEQDRLWRLAGRLNLRSHLVLPGRGVKTRELLECADAFVMPSLKETFSLELLEAMAAGVPSIASRLPGTMELLSVDSAWLVQPGDPDELCGAMRESILIPNSRMERARRALEYCRVNFSWSRFLPRLTDAHRNFARSPEARKPALDLDRTQKLKPT